mmetsp:Transcript_68331/g.110946  ORF Transcript_68331/g.110946 Transcript_68331/m.110946 type:complete len:297 (-) Transcript_68331:402-1292(-)|eukprot:CAMPEP_0179431818 /NCGR_PEP_ID=MMETSP0799-20121207/16614_1 /TAXON_ID=46947 /ORGANISM="Geminigera cryophila, Strain CCMP2564" /LENGTH=296 /DNA_ID=CAMNT_0021208941 /DNA_START=54 /DNA_END=944 /DNA_ORIENTATION=-
MFEELPESLKGMKEFLTKADQFKRVPDPVVAVHCKVYALEKGLAERDKNDKSAMDFLLKLMDEVEREKSEIGPVDDAQMQIEIVALKVFKKGDDQYRAGKADMKTVQSLRAASILFEVCKQFCTDGELPFDIDEKYKYAKVKASEIYMCLKEGRTPQPPSLEDEMPMPPPDHPPPAAHCDNGMAAVPGVPDFPTPHSTHSHPLPPAYTPPPASAPPPPVVAQPVAVARPLPPPAAASAAPRPHYSRSTVSYENMAKAEKNTKYALSALQFEDVTEAVKNLKSALLILDPSLHHALA